MRAQALAAYGLQAPPRAVWRPPGRAWAALAIPALLLVYAAAPQRLRGHWLIVTPICICLGILLVRRLWELNPAVNMCAAIVLSIFSGAWFQIGLGGLPLDRLLLLVVLLQFLLRAPGVAHSPRLRIGNVHLLMALAVIYVLVSAAASGTLQSGFLPLVDMFGVAPYLAFLLAPAVFSGERERELLLVTLVALGGYLGLTAIFESLGPHGLVFPHYIVRVDAELPDERAGGPFQSSVVEGFATYACAVAAAIALTHWRRRGARVLAGIVAVVCVFGCFVTLERGVWIAAILATAAAALATRRGRRLLVPAAVACALAIGGALLLSPALSHKTSNRVNNENSVWARQNQTSAGLRMVAARPLVGFGWERYKRDSLAYFRQSAGYPQNGYVLSEAVGTAVPPLPLHNTYLAFAVELGLVGALLWLAVLLCGVGGAILSPASGDLPMWKLSLLALAVFYLVVAFVDPHEQAFSLLLLWSWAGVALGAMPAPARARAGANVLTATYAHAGSGGGGAAGAAPEIAAPRPPARDGLGFLIVGAPKAGTTSLFEYMRVHPQLHLPAEKELYFFNIDRNYRRGVDWYLQTVSRDAAPGTVWGEATTEYMSGVPYRDVGSEARLGLASPDRTALEEEIPRRIREAFPGVRLLCVLRDPVERAYSHYRMMALGKVESRSFEQAVDELIEPAALEQARLVRTRVNGYVVNGEYARLLGGFLRVFADEQLEVLFSEELRDRPAETLAGVFRFIGVDADFVPPNIDTRYRAAAVEQRIPGLNLVTWQERLAQTTAVRGLWHALPGGVRATLDRSYNVANYRVEMWNARRGEAPDDVPEAAFAKLREHFRPDGEALAAMLNREIPWLDGPER